MDRLTQSFVARSRRTSAVFNLPMLLAAFQPRGPTRFFPGAENQEKTWR
jgi:hypothetical protein